MKQFAVIEFKGSRRWVFPLKEKNKQFSTFRKQLPDSGCGSIDNESLKNIIYALAGEVPVPSNPERIKTDRWIKQIKLQSHPTLVTLRNIVNKCYVEIDTIETEHSKKLNKNTFVTEFTQTQKLFSNSTSPLNCIYDFKLFENYFKKYNITHVLNQWLELLKMCGINGQSLRNNNFEQFYTSNLIPLKQHSSYIQESESIVNSIKHLKCEVLKRLMMLEFDFKSLNITDVNLIKSALTTLTQQQLIKNTHYLKNGCGKSTNVNGRIIIKNLTSEEYKLLTRGSGVCTVLEGGIGTLTFKDFL